MQLLQIDSFFYLINPPILWFQFRDMTTSILSACVYGVCVCVHILLHHLPINLWLWALRFLSDQINSCGKGPVWSFIWTVCGIRKGPRGLLECKNCPERLKLALSNCVWGLWLCKLTFGGLGVTANVGILSGLSSAAWNWVWDLGGIRLDFTDGAFI